MGDELRPPLTEDDNVRGPDGEPFTIVVFGDYECPLTARLWRTLRESRPSSYQFRSGVRFREAYRHYPLTRVHPHAMVAAQAAEAAGDQGRFWEMHDTLFEHQDALEVEHLSTYARQLGLDVGRFDEDLAFETFADAVRADLRSGIGSGVSATPTVFVNGVRITLETPEHLPEQLNRLAAASTDGP